MSERRLGILLFTLISGTTLAPVPAQAPSDVRPPGDTFLLVQAELDYLPAAERPITLEIDRAGPAAVLRQIRDRSGLVIEVQGSLPRRPLLSASYRDAKTRTVLEWFARQVPVSFRAQPPNTLWVVVEDRRKTAAPADAR